MPAHPLMPVEVAVAMRRARWRYAALAAAIYVGMGAGAILFAIGWGIFSVSDALGLAAMISIFVVLATLVRPLWLQRPVLRPVPMAAADAGQALMEAWRGRAKTRPLAGGVLVEPTWIAMPAWFMDTAQGTWMATTTGTAWHLERSIAAPRA